MGKLWLEVNGLQSERGMDMGVFERVRKVGGHNTALLSMLEVATKLGTDSCESTQIVLDRPVIPVLSAPLTCSVRTHVEPLCQTTFLISTSSYLPSSGHSKTPLLIRGKAQHPPGCLPLVEHSKASVTCPSSDIAEYVFFGSVAPLPFAAITLEC